MPIFYYPVQKDDRATGFLIPTYGSSTIRGQSLSNAFFWAISRSQDLTLLHDWYSHDGPGLRHRIPVCPRPGLGWLPALLQPAGARGAVHGRHGGDRTTPSARATRCAARGRSGSGASAVRAVPRRLLLRHRGAADVSPERVRRVAAAARLQRVGGRELARARTSRARSTAASTSTARRAPPCAAARRVCCPTTESRCSGSPAYFAVNAEGAS